MSGQNYDLTMNNKNPDPVKFRYQYVNQPDGSFRKKKIYKKEKRSKKKLKPAGSYELVKSSRSVYHPTPASGYIRKTQHFMKKVPKSVSPPAADKDNESEPNQKEPDQNKPREPESGKTNQEIWDQIEKEFKVAGKTSPKTHDETDSESEAD
tara:strand:- start:958 stop:1413 length:456 start_codon:yes stop_codon:yes gene_type:complete